jgi:hypothetical protein
VSQAVNRTNPEAAWRHDATATHRSGVPGVSLRVSARVIARWAGEPGWKPGRRRSRTAPRRCSGAAPASSRLPAAARPARPRHAPQTCPALAWRGRKRSVQDRAFDQQHR